MPDSWEAPAVSGTSPINDCRVQYRVAGAEEWTRFFDSVTAIPGATITGLTPGAQYQVRIRAASASGLGEYSVPVAASTFSPPSAPRGAVVKVVGQAVQVTWTAPVTD